MYVYKYRNWISRRSDEEVARADHEKMLGEVIARFCDEVIAGRMPLGVLIDKLIDDGQHEAAERLLTPNDDPDFATKWLLRYGTGRYVLYNFNNEAV
jgi:hypothetical protein